jgi:hypothetical protein
MYFFGKRILCTHCLRLRQEADYHSHLPLPEWRRGTYTAGSPERPQPLKIRREAKTLGVCKDLP